MSFFYSLEMADFSLSVKLFASAPKLCWKHFIVSRKRIWLPMFTIRISVGFFRPIFKSVVLHTPALKPFNKRKKSNLQRLCAMTVILYLFSLTLSLQKLCAYPIISPVMCEWCKCILLFIISFRFSIKFSDIEIPFILFVLWNFIIDEYKKASNFSENNIFLAKNFSFGKETSSISFLSSANVV